MPNITTVIHDIIPNFDNATEITRQLFLDSEEGIDLTVKIRLGHFDEDYVLYSDQESKKRRQDRIKNAQQVLKDSFSFIALRREIIQNELKKRIPIYQTLDDTEQVQLANTDYSIEFYESDFKNRSQWNLAFLNDETGEIVAIHRKLDEQHTRLIEQAAAQLSHLFSQIIEPNKLCDIAVEIYLSSLSIIDKKNKLAKYLKHDLDTNKRWIALQDRKNQEAYSNRLALSSLQQFVHNNFNEYLDYLNRIADAHTFYQFFGLSTEHRSWELDYLDIYNYSRAQENVRGIRNIMHVLLIPQQALFHEYTQIAKYEKNRLNIILRAIIPIMVIGVCMVLFFSLLMPVVIPELLEIFMLIPALYLATAAASLYVEFKNQVYTSMMSYWWGDFYQTPAFQVNDRMLRAFQNDRSKAELVQTFYIKSLKETEQIEKQFLSFPSGTLTSEEIKAYQENIIKKSTLLLEWYDIHSNERLGSDETPNIVKNRLDKECHAELAEWDKNRRQYANEFIDAFEDHKVRNAAQTSWQFFRPNTGVKKLSDTCQMHQEKIALAETIYQNVYDLGYHHV